MLFEAEIALSAGFSYIRSLVFAGLVVGACAGCEIDDAGFVIALKFVLRFH